MPTEAVQVEDPNDPEVILRDLPERERVQFLRQYHEELQAVRSGTVHTMPADVAIMGWRERLARARTQ